MRNQVTLAVSEVLKGWFELGNRHVGVLTEEAQHHRKPNDKGGGANKGLWTSQNQLASKWSIFPAV
jgi:hypothetical protein